MKIEEVLAGLTNDLVLQRLRRFFVTKGLPDGKYLLECSEMNATKSGHRGRIDMVLREESVRVIVIFRCGQNLSSDLSLEISNSRDAVEKDGEIVYRFSGTLRPNHASPEVRVEP